IAIVVGRWRSALWTGGAAIGGLVLALPVLLPYRHLAAAGVVRPLESVAQFSATFGGYLHSASRLHAGWSAPFFDRDVSVFFAGVTAIVLAVIGLLRARGEHTVRRRAVLTTVAVVGVVLSLGPATAVYRWLYEWATPLHGLRAAARFGYLYLVAVALLAAYGVAWVQQRLRPGRPRLVVAVVALALVTVEAWSAPIHTVPFDGVPGIYRHVAEAPEPVVLVEMPFYPPEAFFQNGEYVLNSTAHWRPLMNGYSGYMPDSYRERAPYFWYFPDARALDRLQVEGATHVMVHLERFPPHEADEIRRVMNEQHVLTLIA